MTDDLAGLDRAQLEGILAGGPTPLFATVSGSHIYGFPSPNSDVDLRGCHQLPLRDVVGLALPNETFEKEEIHAPPCRNNRTTSR